MPANKPWDQNLSGRSSTGTQGRRRVLILCEDSKSSRFYFEGFKIDPKRAQVETVGAGMNTDSLVEEAIRRKEIASAQHQPFNEVWCVFDRDSFALAQYDRAFQLARNNGIKIAWANEAFELWYLLHFNYHDTSISRRDYAIKLSPNLEYDKADEEIYKKVKPHQETALRNARLLEKRWNEAGENHPERQNPSTSIHKLVEFLNELGELGPAD
jgi:hypothetical protein